MRIKCLWSFLFLMCCSCVFLSEAKSQQVADVAISFDQDTVSVTGGQTFSNKISIRNLTDKTIELIPSAVETMSLSGLIKLPQRIILQAREQKSYPLKYMGDRNILKSNHQSFSIGFSSDDQSIRLPKPVSFFIKLNDEKTLVLQTEQPAYYLDLSTNQVQLLVQASNFGLVPITFKLLFSGYPQGFTITGDVMQVTLQPGGQTLLPLTATMRYKSSFQDFDFVMQGIDEEGRILAASRVRIMRVGSVKRFGAINNLENDFNNNTVALQYLSLGQGNSIYQFQAYGDLELEENKNLNYRLNIDYYQEQKALNAYDTYIDYQDKDWGVKVGNIYENLDQTISGRGVKASYKFSKNRSISLYGVENNYMLFSQLQNLIPGAKIIGANYAVRSEDNQESYLTYLHREHSYREIKSDQVSGKTAVRFNAQQQLGLEGGYSMERTDYNGSKHAFAMGINYNYSTEQYQIMSMNYYSSPYYTGLRRGLIQSDTRISKVLENNQSIAARISYLDNNPKFQERYKDYYINNPSRIQIYELGYHTGLGKFQLDFRPYFIFQEVDYQGFGIPGIGPANWKSNAIRGIGDVNFFSTGHRFSLRTDYGYTYKNTSNKPLSPFHSLRMTGTYGYRFIGFNTYIQINPYYLNDLLATASDANFRIYSFGPNMQINSFKGTLQAQVAGMYSYYGFSRSNNLSVNGNAKWHLKGNWSLTADIFYNFMRNRLPLNYLSEANAVETISFNNRQFRVGIEKKFSKFNSAKGHMLQLSFFDDKNKNGVKDPDEATPEAVVVKIAEDVASTDGKGRVKFLNMAKGSYAVLVENNQGWVAQGPISIVLTKNQRLAIPLVKTRILKGRIKPIAGKYLQTNPELSGIRINAVDKESNTFTTLSDADGNFTFFLPLGNYNVTIPTAGMPFSIENPNQEIDLSEKGTVYLQDFNYKDERRKVGIKRF